MSIITDEYFPADLALETNEAGTRIDRFSIFGGQVAVNHDVLMPNNYSAAHETRVVLGAIGLSSTHVANTTSSPSYLVSERQRQVAIGLGIPPNSSAATITAHMLRRDMLLIETPAQPTVILNDHGQNLLEGIAHGIKVAELDEAFPPIPNKIATAPRYLQHIEKRLGVSSLAAVMLYGHITGQLPKPRNYFQGNNEPGHALLADGTILPPHTEISLKGRTLLDAQLKGLYYKGGLVRVGDDVEPRYGKGFTGQEMTLLGLLAIGMQRQPIAKAMDKQPTAVSPIQERLARRLGLTNIHPASIVSRAFASGLLRVEKAVSHNSLAVGLVEYIRCIDHYPKLAPVTQPEEHRSLLSHILRKHVPTPAAAITYGHVHGLLPAARGDYNDERLWEAR